MFQIVFYYYEVIYLESIICTMFFATKKSIPYFRDDILSFTNGILRN